MSLVEIKILVSQINRDGDNEITFEELLVWFVHAFIHATS